MVTFQFIQTQQATCPDFRKVEYLCSEIKHFTVLTAKRDSDVMIYLQSYQGLIIVDRSLVY